MVAVDEGGPMQRSGCASVCVAIALGCVATTAPADDGSVVSVSGAVRLMKDQGSIRMVTETVRARVSPDSIEVDCVFVLKNEGAGDTVLVGFPDGSGGNEILSFRSWVDGAEVKCRHVPDADSTSDSSWWTKRVAFARGAVRTIRDHYTVEPSWYPTEGASGFFYDLETGASWKGTIGSAHIVATLDGIPLTRVLGADPEARQVGRTFRWLFQNFEPGTGGSPVAVALRWRDPGRFGSVEEPDSLGK